MFRTILISKASKLKYMQGYLVIFNAEEETRVYLKEVSTLIIEVSHCTITTPLLTQLIKHNISVILCDENKQPAGTVLGLANHYQSSGNIFNQTKWNVKTKASVWSMIIAAKISMQLSLMKMYDLPNYDLLEKYLTEIRPKDKTNREGLAAKVYFFALFGKAFNRKEQNIINELLNYGYSIILSCFNREVVQAGYLTQLGIFHIGKTNPFNLSSDLMEPFRPLVDILVLNSLNKNDPKREIRKVLTKKVRIDEEERYIDDAIRIYVSKVIRLLNRETEKFPIIEFLEREHYNCDKSHATNYYV